MIFVGLKRYFISTISNHSLSVQLRVLTAETMEISASLNKLVVVKGQAGSTTEAVLFRSIFCKIRWEQQVGAVFLNIGILKCSLITEKGRTTCCAEDAASSRP